MGQRKEKKARLDVELVARGLAPLREKGAALIMAGEVLVDGQRVLKPAHPVLASTRIEIREKYPYVSRAAFKLVGALEAFAIDPGGKRILDIGISSGGFSDLLLQRGAAAAVGVDVTVSQVNPRLRQDPRLILIEKNARFLQPEDIPFSPDLIVMDLSFISILKVLPALKAFAKVDILALVKPQFEAEKGRVGRGGVIRDPQRLKEIVLGLKRKVEDLGFAVRGFTAAGVKGRKGNQEFFFFFKQGKGDCTRDDEIIRIITESR